MKRSLAFLALPLLYTTSLVAQPAAKETLRRPVRLAVRPGDSTVAFTVKKWGVMREQGRFRDFSGTIDYDPGRPAASRVTLTVEAEKIYETTSLMTMVGGRIMHETPGWFG